MESQIPHVSRSLLAVALTFAATVALTGSHGVAAHNKVVPPPGSQLSNPKGNCLTLHSVRDVVIENLTIGPCGAHGIELVDAHNVVVRNVAITGTAESGIYAYDSSGLTVEESIISDTVSGVYVLHSTGVEVNCNTIVNPRGPIPRGQFVQFNNVTGAGNRISCNAGRNEPGKGTPEDAINLFQSSGTAQSPITVSRNLLVGGGPSPSGGGILLGDAGGSYQVAENNTVVDPGQYGIGVASGSDLTIRNNRIYGSRKPFTNVGIYVWNQYEPACRAITVRGNAVRWTSKDGTRNPFWDGGNCGRISGERDNNFAADLTPDLADSKAPDCGCKKNGPR